MTALHNPRRRAAPQERRWITGSAVVAAAIAVAVVVIGVALVGAAIVGGISEFLVR